MTCTTARIFLLCGLALLGACADDGGAASEACDKTDLDEDYMPSLEPSDYTNLIDNPLLPLVVGARWTYDGEDEIIHVEVLDETYTTATGVECLVVRDTATDKDGVVVEDTRDWFAQDMDGNVWYFGEDTAEYVDGVKDNTEGSWEAGVNGALPGVVMYAEIPAVGTKYRQEYSRCEAEDMGEILATGESVSGPTGDYTDCVRIRDYTPLEPDANEHKLYCPGIGLVLVEDAPVGADSGEAAETLTEVDVP